jgi:hypothetical protein
MTKSLAPLLALAVLGCADPATVVGPDAAPTAPDAAPPRPVACALDLQYRYAFEGVELAFAYDDTALSPPRTFTRKRMFLLEPERTVPPCATELPACDSPEIDIGEVATALLHPDVVAAFASAPTTFGRPGARGGGWNIERSDGRRLVSGGAGCGNDPQCREAPQALNQLGQLLGRLDEQEMKKPSCRTFGM